MDASEKILELRDIVKEIADHESAISDLKRRMRIVLELDASRLDPHRRSTVDQKRRILDAVCSRRSTP
jgi:hypothetical protein